MGTFSGQELVLTDICPSSCCANYSRDERPTASLPCVVPIRVLRRDYAGDGKPPKGTLDVRYVEWAALVTLKKTNLVVCSSLLGVCGSRVISIES